MSKTDRVRVYYNLHKKCFSIQDYKTGLVTKHTNQLNLSNAMFVVRKSGNERVRSEGKKNVHAFVNGIVNDKPSDTNSFHNSYRVRYNPYEMDYFHYERIVNNKPKWLPVDNHWIGDVYLFIENGKPVMYADIDKLSGKKLSASASKGKPLMVIKDDSCIKRYYDGGGFSMEFLRKKQKQIENKKKLLAI